MQAIKFTNGKIIKLIPDSNNYIPFSSYLFSGCLLFYKTQTDFKSNYSGDNIDAAGNKWSVGSDKLIITNKNGNVLLERYLNNYVTNVKHLTSFLFIFYISGIKYLCVSMCQCEGAVNESRPLISVNFYSEEAFKNALKLRPPNIVNQDSVLNYVDYPNLVVNAGAGGHVISNANTFVAYKKLAEGGTEIVGDIDEDTDPYNPGGTTDTGGGGGSFQRPSVPVPFPDIPGLSATDSGFVKLFAPTKEQIQSLASYLWSELFDIDTFKKLFANPMDCILGLSILPFPVPKGAPQELKVGNIGTGISMDTAGGQFYKFDMGTITINEYFKSYLDYSPFTKIDIYLPFIGTRPLDVDEVMGKPLKVDYMVDILSGACVAFVSAGTSVLYTFTGQCAASVPVTGSDHTSIIQNAISIAGQIGTAVATGGLASALSTAASVAGTVAASKTRTEKSGSFSGYASLMGIRTPYLIFSTPRQAVAGYQNTYEGYPGFITQQLNTLSGFTQVEKIHLEKTPATMQELAEIEALLKEGVII